MKALAQRLDMIARYVEALRTAIHWQTSYMSRMREYRRWDGGEYASIQANWLSRAQDAKEARDVALRQARKARDKL